MIPFLLAIQALSVSNAVTPPRAPPPPPIYMPGPGGNGEVIKYIVDAEVRAGAVLLWSGPLRVGGGFTTVRHDQSEPGDAACGQNQTPSAIVNTVSLSLYNVGRDGSVAVTARWSHPGDQPCGPGANTRTVELAASADLAPGASTTLKGDGGLTIRLRRR